ncbi:hypothetical protein VOLCADRAFT_89149 [Volvox carteri f. nagariensis]|uniref:RAP domain-containing protein n=1 Tax=Volvox carteri f. nagariensis TaxID=3068 RepID=D8TQX5_VOLCA|nr:uncharacterized protein VOLCADRAFT_89149 [Volvox carteri f. nagariensis]EFJ50233.1 hypothetical protein VOLCADRAFT_89149 [Volvox carteri f. nagariensis]|eukprot:XP_002948853.1 hypothetical protein VOLCADRAFT_89149 [Volvox carteri f. nagariensis]
MTHAGVVHKGDNSRADSQNRRSGAAGVTYEYPAAVTTGSGRNRWRQENKQLPDTSVASSNATPHSWHSGDHRSHPRRVGGPLAPPTRPPPDLGPPGVANAPKQPGIPARRQRSPTANRKQEPGGGGGGGASEVSPVDCSAATAAGDVAADGVAVRVATGTAASGTASIANVGRRTDEPSLWPTTPPSGLTSVSASTLTPTPASGHAPTARESKLGGGGEERRQSPPQLLETTSTSEAAPAESDSGASVVRRGGPHKASPVRRLLRQTGRSGGRRGADGSGLNPQAHPPASPMHPYLLTGILRTASSVPKLKKYVTRYGSQFNNLHICCCLNRLAKAPDARAATQRETVRQLLDELGDMLVRHMPYCDARELCNVLWVWGKLGHTPRPEIWEAMRVALFGIDPAAAPPASVTAASPVAGKLELAAPQGLVNAAWALARLECSDPWVWRRLAECSLTKLHAFVPYDISNLSYALVVARQHRAHPAHEAVMRALAVAAEARLSEFCPQDISNMLWAYARCGMAQPALFSAAASIARMMAADFSQAGLVQVIWAYAAMRVYDAPLLAPSPLGGIGGYDSFALGDDDTSFSSSPSSADISMGTLARAYVNDLATSGGVSRSGGSSGATAALTPDWAMDLLTDDDGTGYGTVGYDSFTDSAAGRERVNAADVTATAVNLAQSQVEAFAAAAEAAQVILAEMPPQLLPALCESLRPRIDTLDSGSLAVLVWALATLGHADTELFHAAAAALTPRLRRGEVATPFLAHTAWAFTVAGVYDSDLYDALAASASALCAAGLVPATSLALGNVLWALGSAGHYDAELYGNIGRVAVAVAGAATPSSMTYDRQAVNRLALVMLACAYAGHSDAELYEMVSEVLRSAGAGALADKSLANICWSLAVVDHPDLDLLAELFADVARRDVAAMGVRGCTQLFHCALWLQDLVPGGDRVVALLPRAVLEVGRANFLELAKDSNVSDFQAYVFNALDSMRLSPSLETKTLDQLFSLDVALCLSVNDTTNPSYPPLTTTSSSTGGSSSSSSSTPTTAASSISGHRGSQPRHPEQPEVVVRVVVEANGPQHYLRTHPTALEGSTRLRSRLLRARGWVPLHVHWQEWQDLGGDVLRQRRYLRAKLGELLQQELRQRWR